MDSPLFNPNMPTNPTPQVSSNPVKNSFNKLKDSIRNHKKLTAALAVIFILTIAFLAYYQVKKSSQTTQTNLPNQNAFFDPNSSSINLISPKTTYSLNEKIKISVIANSQDIPVTAFDILIGYDSNYLDIAGHEAPLASNFMYFGQNDTKVMRIAAVLKPDINAQAFKDIDLADLSLSPKKAGKTTLKLFYAPNSVSDSNLINSASQDILGSAKGIEIEIK